MSMARTNARLFLVLCLAVGSTAAPITLGSSHKDESNGFQIQLPRKWEQVPTKFQEVSLIGRWAGKAKRGRIIPECRVIRLLRVAPQAEAETPADAVKRGIPGYADVLRKQPKDVWELELAPVPWHRAGRPRLHPEPELALLSRELLRHEPDRCDPGAPELPAGLGRPRVHHRSRRGDGDPGRWRVHRSDRNPLMGMTHPPTLRGKTYEGVNSGDDSGGDSN